jgi:RimJ/RimL family protein N-acetyltransferase
MTEAVKGILQWASTRPDINTVLAETNASNIPSIKIVQKNGFEHFDKKGEMLWWRANVKI